MPLPDYKTKYLKYKQKYHRLKSLIKMITLINTLLKSKNESFVFIDLNINDKDRNYIESFVINLVSEYDYFGKFNESMLVDQIFQFLLKNSNQTLISKKISNIIVHKIIKPYLQATFADHLWFKIRLTVPTDTEYVSRWHRDGYFYHSKDYLEKNLPQIKMAGTLIGPPTIFKEGLGLNQEFDEIYNNLYKKFDVKNFDYQKDIENRKEIETQLKKYETIQPDINQFTVFVVGLSNRAAIHSEPEIHTDRFFYSIVSGSKEEIKDLATRWNRPFIE